MAEGGSGAVRDGDGPVAPPRWLRGLRWGARRAYAAAGYRIGAGTLAEAVRRTVARRCRPGPYLVDDFMGELRFVCDLSEHMGSQIFFRGAYSRDELAVLGRLLTKEAVFVDVGANQGEFTVFAAARLSRGAVYSVEPQQQARDRLAVNVRINGLANVTVYDCAVGASDRAAVTIYAASTPDADGTTNSGLGTLYPVAGRDTPLGSVAVRRLEALLPGDLTRLDAIKIDVEGGELTVLQGAQGIIDRHRPAVLFESNTAMATAAGGAPDAAARWLVRRGYALYAIEPGASIRRVSDTVAFGNILALPPGHAWRETARTAG